MAGNFLHFLAESIHHFFIEQPALHILDQIDQVDRWALDNNQHSDLALLDFSQPMDWGVSDFNDSSN